MRRVVLLSIGVVALLIGILWFRSVDTPEIEVAAAPPTLSAPRAMTSPPVRPSTEPPEEDPPQNTDMPKCRPTFRGEGPPLELTLTGTDLPPVPPNSTILEVSWTEEGKPRPSKGRDRLRAHLGQARQLYTVIHAEPPAIPDASSLEAFIATSLDGVIELPREGRSDIYLDAQLRRFHRL